MKKMTVLLLALLLLWGCGREDAPAESLPEGETAASAVSTPAEEIAPTAAADTGVELLVLEPHWDVDIYPDSMKQYVSLFIFSKEPVSEEEVQVELPVDVAWSPRFAEDNNLGDPPCEWEEPGKLIKFSYQLYMSYRGADWAALAEKYPQVQDAQARMAELVMQGNALGNPEYIENQTIVTQFEEEFNRYQKDYYTLTSAQLPQFYVYQMMIQFDTGKLTEDIAFSSLTLTVRGEARELEVGQVRLHTALFAGDWELPGIKGYHFGVYTTPSEARYNTGRRNDSSITFTAEEDITLTGCGYLTEGTELRRIQVQQTSPDNGTMDFYWDGSMPLDIAAGTRVRIAFEIYDPRLRQEGFDFHNWTYMTYELQGKEYRYCIEDNYWHVPNYYEVYAVYFDGLDLSDYYQKYYYPFLELSI